MGDGLTTHVPGNFCWVELATSDPAAAKDFYSGLFGWQAEDLPVGEGMVYTMLRLGGKEVGALYGLQEDQKAQGIPPNWLAYVAVAKADEAAALAASLGGTVLAAPFDVAAHGRMAVLQDPTGATVALWEAKDHKGAGHFNAQGGMCWHELATGDTKVAEDFYTRLFGWTAQHSNSPGMEYIEWVNQGKHIGGLLHLQWAGSPPAWTTYFMVASCDKSSATAEALGGKVIVPPQDIPNVGRFSVIADPQGACFSIFEPTPTAVS